MFVRKKPVLLLAATFLFTSFLFYTYLLLNNSTICKY